MATRVKAGRIAYIACLALVASLGCDEPSSGGSESAAARDSGSEPGGGYLAARRRMVELHLRARGIADERVLDAMGSVPREEFVPPALRSDAYADGPLPIGLEQTISQPYIVAFMSEAVEPKRTDRALEIGTGSGYQAAVLSHLVDTVFSVEILPELTERAAALLARLGFGNVVVETRDGYRGWPEHAPFDVVVVTAAPNHVPKPLVDQLAPGGRMIIPVGERWQHLRLIRKDADGRVEVERRLDVRFVPMTGEAEGASR